MLDLHELREHPDRVRADLARRGDPSGAAAVDRVLALDERRRALIGEVEELKARRNAGSRDVGERKKRGEDAGALVSEMKELAERIRGLDAQLAGAEDALEVALLGIPNRPHPRVPRGGAEANEVVAQVGAPPDLGFEPLPHWELGSALGILDMERGARLAGSGFPLLLGAGARLARALVDVLLDLQTREHGYIEVSPPLLANREALTGTGQLPKFEEDQYRTEPDDFFLIPTAEVPLTNLHRGEILDAERLPLAYTAYTPCFRREAGAAGRDTRGLLRVHQFDKVELVRFVPPETADKELERLTRHAERALELLGLPYRRVLLAAGDLGFANAITYDLEVWSAGVGEWLEVSSCSSYADYQARRADIRYRPAPSARPEPVYTLNGSALGLARTLVAVLENNQRADGSVDVPEALRDRAGMDRLTA